MNYVRCYLTTLLLCLNSNLTHCLASYAETLEMKTGEPDRPMAMPAGTGLMMAPNAGLMASSVGMMVSNAGMMASSNSGMNSGMLVASNTAAPPSGMNVSNPGLIGSQAPSAGMASNAGFVPQKSRMIPGMSANMATGLSAGAASASAGMMASRPGSFPSSSGMSQHPGVPQNTGVNPGMARTMGMMTASAGLSSNTRSVPSHMGSVSMAKPQGAGVTSPGAWTNSPFAYPSGAVSCQPYNVAPNLYYYTASGN